MHEYIMVSEGMDKEAKKNAIEYYIRLDKKYDNFLLDLQWEK